MELAQNTFRELARIVHDETGIVIGADKTYLVRHRLEPLLRAEGLHDFDALLHRLKLRTAGRLRVAVIDAITVKETRFFRDHTLFECLHHHVFPEFETLLDSGRQRIRIWSAAASMGQEAYSVAMLVREFAEQSGKGAAMERRFSILASDISPAAIDAAKSGQYSRSEIDRGLSEARLHKHFRHRGSRWIIDESLHRMVHFRTFNLLNSPAELGPFDLILCRNVLIYFDEPTRRKICREMYTALHPGGYLALGSAESLYGMTDRFETVVLGKTVLYRRPRRAV